jgi:hypothetical protein
VTVTDADVLTFARAGCNAAEVAAYADLPEDFAQLWIDEVKAAERRRVRELERVAA